MSVPPNTHYYLPPEWVKQERIIITLAHPQTDYKEQIAQVENDYADIISTISQFEPVTVLCYDDAHLDHVKLLLAKQKFMREDHVQLVTIPTNDVWARDYGPITVYDAQQQRHFLNFKFNAWGNKYPHQHDDAVNARLAKVQVLNQRQLETIDFVLEGGSLEVDAQGHLLTTESCLLNPSRNPHHDRAQIETLLQQYLGVKKILWLTHSELIGDDTDGHIDMLARFTESGSIVYTACDNPSDPQYDSLALLEQEIFNLTQISGEPFECKPLYIPKAFENAAGDRFPGSYANFLIINNAVLVPAYDDARDNEARSVIATCFPTREIISVPCSKLIEQFGSLHCATMQIPEER
jgi:agmatine deiminase